MNGGGHELCAFSLWEADVEVQRLRIENMALRQEVDRLRKGEAAIKEVPKPPQEKVDA